MKIKLPAGQMHLEPLDKDLVGYLETGTSASGGTKGYWIYLRQLPVQEEIVLRLIGEVFEVNLDRWGYEAISSSKSSIEITMGMYDGQEPCYTKEQAAEALINSLKTKAN